MTVERFKQIANILHQPGPSTTPGCYVRQSPNSVPQTERGGMQDLLTEQIDRLVVARRAGVR